MTADQVKESKGPPAYDHVQPGHGIRIVLAIALVTAMVAFLSAQDATIRAVLLAIAGVVAACLVLFRSLRVTVTDDMVQAAFGNGLIHRRIPFDRIEGVRAVRFPWYYGWGVRLIPGGTLFAVSGLDAVELDLEGERRFLIGTDEPEALAAAIEAVQAD